MSNKNYEYEGTSYISHFINSAIGITGAVFLFILLFNVLGMQYDWVKYAFGFLGFCLFMYSQVQWVYHNVGYEGRNIMIAGMVVANFFWVYHVGQVLGGK